VGSRAVLDAVVKRNIIMCFRDIGREDVDWIHLAQDRDQWWAVVNTVTNFWFQLKVENFVLDEQFLASQEGLCGME
jgi:hypothetical protein